MVIDQGFVQRRFAGLFGVAQGHEQQPFNGSVLHAVLDDPAYGRSEFFLDDRGNGKTDTDRYSREQAHDCAPFRNGLNIIIEEDAHDHR